MTSTDRKNRSDKRRSISSQAVYSTITNCVVFGLVALVVGLSFYSVSFTNYYLKRADSLAHQVAMSATHATDVVTLSDEVMSRYYSLSEDQKMLTGTGEYRELFSDIDTGRGSSYSTLFHLLAGSLEYNDVYDVYVAMYDRENSRIVYIVDSDDNDADRLYPGDWEPVNRKGMNMFMDYDGEGGLYDVDFTEKYGVLCTVGVPLYNDNNEIRSFMLVDLSVKDVALDLLRFAVRIIIAMAVATLLLAYYQTKRIEKNLVRPVNTIVKASKTYVEERHKGNTNNEHFKNLGIHTGDEIEDLADTMAQMEKDLAEYEENLTRITAEKERIQTELSLATEIQTALLPHVYPAFPNRSEFDIYAISEPAREVGGDFYDYFLIDDDHLCLVMADVSGKGIPAALFMMIAKTILQSCAMLGKEPAEILERTNEALSTDNQTGMFVTVWLGILEIATGKLTCANAGHEYPVLKRADGSYEIFKDKHGFVIGGMENSRYKEYTINMGHGDRIYLYTDGVPEATDASNNMYGTARMVQALNRDPNVGIRQLIDNVCYDIVDFIKDEQQFDDLTMMCLEYK
ncbi:MAG: SpoIIE family protein phosphatase [Butyrivibrio sp.]|nr:SpoIIE family protein phosphatase [Butyrivibrio sp.]